MSFKFNHYLWIVLLRSIKMKNMFCSVLLSILLFSSKANSIPAKRNMVSLFSSARVRIKTLDQSSQAKNASPFWRICLTSTMKQYSTLQYSQWSRCWEKSLPMMQKRFLQWRNLLRCKLYAVETLTSSHCVPPFQQLKE